jgi:phosphoribosylamine--glycine ligase
LLKAAATGRLDEIDQLRWRSGAAVAVVMAAAGYPGSPRKGDPITGVDGADGLDGVSVLQAGTAADANGALVTDGGRVLAVTATATTIAEARDRAYQGVIHIRFPDAHYRTDIAKAASW